MNRRLGTAHRIGAAHAAVGAADAAVQILLVRRAQRRVQQQRHHVLVGASRSLVQQSIVVVAAERRCRSLARTAQQAGRVADVGRMAERVHVRRHGRCGRRHTFPHVLLVVGQRMAACEIEAPTIAGTLLVFADFGVEESAGQMGSVR